MHKGIKKSGFPLLLRTGWAFPISSVAGPLLPGTGEAGGIVPEEEGEAEHVAGDHAAEVVDEVLLLLHTSGRVGIHAVVVTVTGIWGTKRMSLIRISADSPSSESVKFTSISLFS